MTRKNIAVIGGGIAGLTAAHLLSRQHHVMLFERSHRLGGNAYTMHTPDGETLDIAVAVFGKAGYKNFYALLDYLKIETRPTFNSYMSFFNLDTQRGLYVTPSMKGLLAQNFELLSPRMARDFFKLFSGLFRTKSFLNRLDIHRMTLREVLDEIPAFQANTRIVLLSSLCLLSSMSAEEVLNTPAKFFIEKLSVHHDVISPKAVYSVRCVKGGTETYVRALAAPLRDHVELNSVIHRVVREKDYSELHFLDKSGSRSIRRFDAVVFACAPDQALEILNQPSEYERKLLGAWKYKPGRVVVHRDHSAFPVRDLIQAYTFLYTERDGIFDTSVNGALWYEPYASKDSDYISTQHPNFSIRKDLIAFDGVMRTPIYDFQSFDTIAHLPRLNGYLNTYYCGSYFGYGLHEDGVTSAMEVAKLLDAPFEI